MEIEHLRQLAAPLREKLARHQRVLKHGHALDLLAAIAGLRNWPEVNAFPQRLAATHLDDAAAERLRSRIATKLGVDLPVDEVEELLHAQGTPPPDLWPSGPKPGIYVCTEAAHAVAAVRRYLAGTGDALFYTDDVCWDSDSAMQIGEHGIFSRGISRLPTGTLLVSSKLEFTQENWDDLKGHLIAACNAASDGMRVILVCHTPNPPSLHRDLARLLRDEEPEDFVDPTLVGVVSSTGEYQEVRPFVQTGALGRAPQSGDIPAPEHPLPDHVGRQLARALESKPTGWVIAGVHPGQRDVYLGRKGAMAAVLPYVAHLGPAAMIVDNFRGSYGREESTPAALAALPHYPSVESAIEDGYRVIVFEWPSGDLQKLMALHTDKACFVVGATALSASDAVVQRFADRELSPEGLIAVVCRASITTDAGERELFDVFVHCDAPRNARIRPDEWFTDVPVFIAKGRALRWEDQVHDLIERGVLSREALRKQFPRVALPRARKRFQAAA